MSDLLFKDTVLNELAEENNVAQFVSFSPKLEQRFARIVGYHKNHLFVTPEAAIKELLVHSSEQSINIRSYHPESPKSRSFVYGKTSLEEALAQIRRFAQDGLYTILNETIDVKDGGVSGVVLGQTIEFSPDDTPRCVEKPGIASLPREFGLKLLEIVYRFRPHLDSDQSDRIEFSIHPRKRGYRNNHTVIWERDKMRSTAEQPIIRWPNRFSQLIGDKAFGLLVASILGLPTPRTTVFSRRVAPFTFGELTNSNEGWLRTAPRIQIPGKFTTLKGWTDPFVLMQEEDPKGTDLASILYQSSVEANYSGAAAINETGETIIEGVHGKGDEFMIGRVASETLPKSVDTKVAALLHRVRERLGPARVEWVLDDERVWVVQLHRGFLGDTSEIIVPGSAKEFVQFRVDDGLEILRQLIDQIKGTDRGIALVGRVGILSHFGDTLRAAGVPSYVSRDDSL